MTFIIFDTEYTSWKGCQENGWHGQQKKEIVQIAALKVDEHLNVKDELAIFCKPQINPVLSDYFVELTGISNDLIAQKGIFFAEAYEKFSNFVNSNVCYSHGWGSDSNNACDGEIIAENLHLYNLLPNKKIIYKNIAPLFKALYEKHHLDIKSQSSGQIVKLLGICSRLEKLHIDEHNALFDVYSILEGLRYFAADINFQRMALKDCR